MVVINDIATLNDIHPPNKQDVGNRLAMLALKNNYGRTDIVAYSPEFDSLQLAGEKLVVTFKNTGGGLTTRDKQAPTHFELVGPGSRAFVPAKATITGDTVVLSADDVPEPTAFRFAWDKLAEPNLTGGTGLPVGACRAGEVPDYLSLNSLGKEYELVYELDLNELQGTINYSIDRSENITAFDRIGYLLELESSDYGNQALFVSMDAFTDDVKKIAVPQASGGVFFQQSVQGLESVSTVSSLNHKNIEGNIEFWPNNYAQQNAANVPGASNSLFDFGDSMAEPVDGYGSMQIHNTQGKQTLFAFNHWRTGQAADLGIGNSTGSTRDWTFTRNAGDYSRKRLRIYVRPTTGPE
jgi:sialate O-acetylesterase